MSYLPKAIVEKSIKLRTRKSRNGGVHMDYEVYFGIDPFTKKPRRITRSSKEELEKEIADFYRRHRAGGDAAARLTAIQALDAKEALDALYAAKMNVSMLDVVKAYIGGTLEGRVRATKSVSVQKAWSEYIDRKQDGPDKNKTKATVGKWAEVFKARKLDSIAAKEVLEYLERQYGGKKPKTYNSHLLYLKTFFNWCCKEGQEYLAKNPIRNLECRPEPWEEPEYMKPEDVARLFEVLEEEKSIRPELLAQATISFFCGTRAVEIRRMAETDDAAKIHLEDETIRIAKGKGFQLGRRPRAFHIEPTALAWMRSFDFSDAVKKITKQTINEIYALARRNKIPVFQNCGRHTFITYHVAAYGDPAKTQAIVGTSAKMRAENYCGLASKAKAEEYFKIMPRKSAV